MSRAAVSLKVNRDILCFNLWTAARTPDPSSGNVSEVHHPLQGSQRLPDSYRKHPLFGAGRNRPETWWKALTRQLIGEGYLKEATGHSRFSTLCKLTSQVWRVHSRFLTVVVSERQLQLK